MPKYYTVPWAPSRICAATIWSRQTRLQKHFEFCLSENQKRFWTPVEPEYVAGRTPLSRLRLSMAIVNTFLRQRAVKVVPYDVWAYTDPNVHRVVRLTFAVIMLFARWPYARASHCRRKTWTYRKECKLCKYTYFMDYSSSPVLRSGALFVKLCTPLWMCPLYITVSTH